jgi:hypothetical protein
LGSSLRGCYPTVFGAFIFALDEVYIAMAKGSLTTTIRLDTFPLVMFLQYPLLKWSPIKAIGPLLDLSTTNRMTEPTDQWRKTISTCLTRFDIFMFTINYDMDTLATLNIMILSYPLVLVYVVLPSLPPFKANHALLSGHPRRAIVSSKTELEELDTSPGDLSGISCLGWDGWNTRFKS